MDVCVVRYRSDEERIRPGLRPRDRLIVHDNTERNLGFAVGANAAARQGSDPLICFVNPGGDLAADCLDKLEDVFADPEVVGAYPDIGDAWNLPVREDGEPSYLSGCCLVVRRAAFEQVGGFDERFFMYGEDVDLSWKLRELGRLVHAQDARFFHDPSKDRSFRSLHRVFASWHVVYKRHEGNARLVQSLRDAVFDVRSGHRRQAFARVSGMLDYLARGRRIV